MLKSWPLPPDGWTNPLCESPSFLGDWLPMKGGTVRTHLIGRPILGFPSPLGNEDEYFRQEVLYDSKYTIQED